MNIYDVLHNKFDIETHKRTFVNYLEVVILEDGTIEYAVPSHQEKLVNIYMKKYNITREEVINRCPEEYYFNYTEWLCDETKAVAVWDYFIQGQCNEKQQSVLELLRKEKLYKGEISF